MKKGIEILSLHLRIMNNPRQFSVRYGYHGGRIERRLFDEQGKIVPSNDDVKIIKLGNKDKIIGESPEVEARVWTSTAILGSNLADEQGFSRKTRMTFKQGMMKYIEWRKEHRNDPSFEGHAQKSLEQFGDSRITAITREDVSKWINGKLLQYTDNTIKHKVGAGKNMYSWLAKERKWEGDNPFSGHEWRAKGIAMDVKPVISPEEWILLQNCCSGDPKLLQAVTYAYFTGLRPSEIYRVRPEDFKHHDLTLRVRVTKTGEYERLIAIPRCLSVWAMNHEWKELKKTTVQHRLWSIANSHPSLSGLCMESFRKNYAGMMEQEGSSLEHIDSHQGRYQNTVIKKHYLRDKYRAVKLMRNYMSIFDGKPMLGIVKEQDFKPV